MKQRRSSWLVRFRPKPSKPTSTLLCFPFAGGSPHVFREWAAELPSEIDLIAVQYPGRGMRFREAPLHHSGQIISALIDQEAGLFFGPPLLLFGHSMGALLAFELARALRRRGFPAPQHLFASAFHAPQLPGKRAGNPVTGLTDAEFKSFLESMKGTPPEVMANRELMDLMLPVLRADFGVCDNYVYEAEAPLALPITALGGLHDSEVTVESLGGWRTQTSRAYAEQLFDAEHFYLDEFRPTILRRIVQAHRHIGSRLHINE